MSSTTKKRDPYFLHSFQKYRDFSEHLPTRPHDREKALEREPEYRLIVAPSFISNTCLHPLRSRFSSSGRFDTKPPIAESVICNEIRIQCSLTSLFSVYVTKQLALNVLTYIFRKLGLEHRHLWLQKGPRFEVRIKTIRPQPLPPKNISSCVLRR